ncbi:MAG: hypothetical protein V7K26_03595 [Nostoc sp.]|uniref:hypothetical protein n=1 Tax=Nostoc sp. TaxID=1180 RepID=UPI002FF29F60
MQIKSISYHRVINLGNYESKRLELFAEVQEGEDPEAAISSLAELVERKARESFELIFDVRELKRQRRELSKEVEQLKAEKDKLAGIDPNEPDPDNIPFEAGDTSETTEGVPDKF